MKWGLQYFVRWQVGEERVKKVQPLLNHLGPEKHKTVSMPSASQKQFSLFEGRRKPGRKRVRERRTKQKAGNGEGEPMRRSEHPKT